MKYGLEKLCKTHTGEAWRRVRPSGEGAYVFETREEAEKAKRLCYDADPTIVRIIELPGDF